MKRYTTESVLKGHPDKVCDQISDAILDACLAMNKYAHTAIECLGTGNELVVSGEIDGVDSIDLSSIINPLYQSIGYNNKIIVRNLLRCQSAQLKKGLLLGGAGDQGVMYVTQLITSITFFLMVSICQILLLKILTTLDQIQITYYLMEKYKSQCLKIILKP